MTVPDDPVIYLDCAATTPLSDEVREAMAPWLGGEFGNPSSRHRLGVRAGAAIEGARRALADAVGADPGHVVFTSGGTEANNLAVLGAARARAGRGRHVLIGPAEHPSVRDAAAALADEGFEIEEGRTAAGGGLDVDDFVARLRPGTVVVALMLGSNEHGGVYPVRRVAAAARRAAPDAHVHTDAVQAFGKLEVDLAALGADSVAVSAHKVHGPKGTGALVLAGGRDRLPLRPLAFGGGQQGGRRPGTENVAGIVGFAAAAARADELREATHAHMLALRSELARRLDFVPGARLVEPGGPDGILPSIAAVRVPGPPAEVYLHHLEAKGVMASVGSACQSNKREASPALVALGLGPEDARQVLRFSFSRDSTIDEVRRAMAALGAVATDLLAAT